MKSLRWVVLGLFLSCQGGPTRAADGGVIECGGFVANVNGCPDGSVCVQTMQNCADCTGVCYPK
jgi:hypothetical protein